MALGFHLGLVLILINTLWLNVAWAQSTNNCMSTIITLSPCLSYIQGSGSNPPSSSCCSQLGKVVGSRPECLCVLLKGKIPSLGITIDKTRALALPGLCSVKTPPVSRCDEIGGAPAAAPSASSSIAPAGGST